jgi:hypothetical protein
MLVDTISSGVLDYSVDKPLLIYDWVDNCWDGFESYVCDCWSKGGSHFKSCTLGSKIVKYDKLPWLESECFIDSCKGIFPAGCLTVGGVDISTGERVTSFIISDDCVSQYCIAENSSENRWLSVFEYGTCVEFSQHRQISICIDNIKGPLSMEWLYIKYGYGSQNFSVMFIGAVVVTVGFNSNLLRNYCPSPGMEYYYYLDGHLLQTDVFSEYEMITPSDYNDFASKFGLVCYAEEYFTSKYQLYRICIDTFTFRLFCPLTVVPEQYVYNFVKGICLSRSSCYSIVQGGDATVDFTLFDILLKGCVNGVKCNNYSKYEYFCDITNLSMTSDCFYNFDCYRESFSKYVYVDAEVKNMGHMYFDCSACGGNTRGCRRASNSELKLSRKVSRVLNGVDLKQSISQTGYSFFSTKPSYGYSLNCSANSLQFVDALYGDLSTNKYVGQSVCFCLYVDFQCDHVCEHDPLMKGKRYRVEIDGGIGKYYCESTYICPYYLKLYTTNDRFKLGYALINDYFLNVSYSDYVEDREYIITPIINQLVLPAIIDLTVYAKEKMFSIFVNRLLLGISSTNLVGEYNISYFCLKGLMRANYYATKEQLVVLKYFSDMLIRVYIGFLQFLSSISDFKKLYDYYDVYDLVAFDSIIANYFVLLKLNAPSFGFGDEVVNFMRRHCKGWELLFIVTNPDIT